jgi:IBR domain, a half RING-finger domain
LGGALVRFGPGGDILSIEPAAASAARLQMCNVSCTWYQPSKTATLEFTSSQVMEEVSRELGNTTILNRRPECRTAVDKKAKPWHCYIKVGNLDVTTTSKILREACGKYRPLGVTFGKNSYSSSAEVIGQAVQRLLSSAGNVEAWFLSTSTKSAQIRATATFSTMEQAAKAITELNGYKLPQLGGSKILLSHVVRAKFSILSSMHTAIASELAKVKHSVRSKGYLEIKSYPSTDKAHRFTTLHIISNTAQEVAKAKAAVEKILKGHTARGGSGIIWDDHFLKPEGMAYLNDLGKEHNVFVYRNAKKCILSLYGDEEDKAIVESILLKAVDDLAVSTFNLDLDDKVPVASHQAGYRTIVEKLGKTAVRLNVTTRPRTITIHGSAEDANWAKAVLKDESGQTTDIESCAEEILTCAVCWCDVTGNYTTSCGHVYDKECFVNQCLSTGGKDIPIRCLGSSGSCQAIISFTELEAALSRDQLDRLLENAFTQHVRTHPANYQYCPTADCDQVYEVSDDGKIYTCSTCLTSICTKCGAVSHEGLTCEQYKKAILGDDAFSEWKKKNDARDCPKCGCTIQKSDGCNHMECKACSAHICWVCMKVFKSGSDTYGHMRAKHGGFYDPGDGFGGL